MISVVYSLKQHPRLPHSTAGSEHARTWDGLRVFTAAFLHKHPDKPLSRALLLES